VLLLAESQRHCDNGVLLLIETSDVAERPGPALILFPAIDML